VISLKPGIALGTLAAGAAVTAVVVAELQPAASPPPHSPVRPVTVLRAAANVTGAIVEDGWFAWMQGTGPWRLPPLAHTVVYVRRGNRPAWRANPAGTYAQTGGIAGGKLVIQLLHERSVIATVDLRTRRLRVLPAPINEPHMLQWRPSASAHRVLYGRFAANDWRIMLADLDTGRVAQLDRVAGHAAYAEPGQLDGRYATWIACPDNHCRVYRYDVDTGTRVEMPPVGGFQYDQFGPSVTRDGTVYFGVSRGQCTDTRLMRWRRGRVRTIYRFPGGTGFEYSHAVGRRRVTVYYDESPCRRGAPSRIDLIRDTGAQE
jgi:hypothetical protein